MIHAVIYQNERKECTGFQIEGHAGYAQAGQDIVCAAVTVLAVNTMNAIERYADDKFSAISDEEAGLIACHFSGVPSYEANLLLNAMILGLSEMAHDENYETYIDLTFEEVQQP